MQDVQQIHLAEHMANVDTKLMCKTNKKSVQTIENNNSDGKSEEQPDQNVI